MRQDWDRKRSDFDEVKLDLKFFVINSDSFSLMTFVFGMQDVDDKGMGKYPRNWISLRIKGTPMILNPKSDSEFGLRLK